MSRNPHPILDHLGVTIRLLRHRRGLSQEALASLADIDRSYMSGIERGRRNISVLNVARIAAALRVPLCDLLHPTVSTRVPAPQPVERLQRVSEAVEQLTETLRIYRCTGPVGRGRPGLESDLVDEWKPGEYLSLS